jgi:hypothetical protein
MPTVIEESVIPDADDGITVLDVSNPVCRDTGAAAIAAIDARVLTVVRVLADTALM